MMMNAARDVVLHYIRFDSIRSLECACELGHHRPAGLRRITMAGRASLAAVALLWGQSHAWAPVQVVTHPTPLTPRYAAPSAASSPGGAEEEPLTPTPTPMSPPPTPTPKPLSPLAMAAMDMDEEEDELAMYWDRFDAARAQSQAATLKKTDGSESERSESGSGSGSEGERVYVTPWNGTRSMEGLTKEEKEARTIEALDRYYGRIGVDREEEDRHRAEIEGAMAAAGRALENGRVMPARLALEEVMPYLQVERLK